jgi:hypothetical protein
MRLAFVAAGLASLALTIPAGAQARFDFPQAMQRAREKSWAALLEFFDTHLRR